MIRKIILVVAMVFIAFILFSSHASASSAGSVEYDANGNPLPVRDPAIATSAEIPDSVKNLPKKIVVDLSSQTLAYYYGDTYLVDEFKISSGVAKLPTPTGTFKVLAKIPVKEYTGRNLDGSRYDLPNTPWNLKFSDLGYYIHDAYWHNNFGHPMSHGCINAPLGKVEKLYAFSDIGTPVIIHN